MVEFIKRDALRVGVVMAMVTPTVIAFTALMVMSGSVSLRSYVQTLLIFGSLSKLLSLCVYPNLAIFYLYLHFKRDSSAKGAVWGTMIMAILVLMVYLVQKIY